MVLKKKDSTVTTVNEDRGHMSVFRVEVSEDESCEVRVDRDVYTWIFGMTR